MKYLVCGCLLFSVTAAVGANSIRPTPIEKLLLKQNLQVPDKYAGKPEMNGIRFSDYKNFWTDWKLVTVRYRRDLDEMRFVYANDIAWKALNAKKKVYPDGAVFAKVGYFAQEDPAFASSAVPAGLARFQFMVRNHETYKSTDGWGYAIFDPSGRTANGAPQKLAEACAACHRIVPERGYVFSQAIRRQAFSVADLKNSLGNLNAGMSRIKFEKTAVKDLPSKTLKRILRKQSFVQNAVGGLRDYKFVGIFKEMLPLLLKETIRTGRPATVVARDGKSFAMATRAKTALDEKCPSGEKAYHLSWTRVLKSQLELNVVLHQNFESVITCQ